MVLGVAVCVLYKKKCNVMTVWEYFCLYNAQESACKSAFDEYCANSMHLVHEHLLIHGHFQVV